MQPVHNETLLESYIEKYDIRKHFPSEVISHLRLYRAGIGDAICEQGEHVSQLYLLVKGKATVSYIAENGKKLSFHSNKLLNYLVIYNISNRWMHYIR
jgi:CRP-like cAMP-binding protein